MTNANLPDRWLLDPVFDGLSDAAWRVHTFGLMWSNQQGTDGFLPTSSVRFLYPSALPGQVVEELVFTKLWKRVGNTGFQILEWSATQSTAAQVASQRQRNKENQQASRARRKKPSDPKLSSDTSAVTSPLSVETRQDQARQDEFKPGQETSGAHTALPALVPGEYQGGPVAWSATSS